MHFKRSVASGLVVLAAAFVGIVACGSSESGIPKNANSADADADTGSNVVCEPGTTTSCYSGPEGTRSVGACKAGVATCNTDGLRWGPCVGEIVPTRELCNGGVDDDCNGKPEPADCVACEPGVGSCDGNVGTSCPDGLHLVTTECDPLLGLTCNAANGTCDGPCSTSALGSGSLGCEFYPTVTANLFDKTDESRFGVIVTNDSAEPVVVTTSKGDTILESRTLAGSTSAVFELPWLTELRGPMEPTAMPGSVRVDQGSYRVRTTRPVTVRQYNPLVDLWYSGDASLLLPVNAWAKEYRVVARHHMSTGEGFYAITAGEDGTIVQLAAPPRGLTIKAGVTGIDTTGSGTVTMNRGDVIEIVTAATASTTNDPTGTLAIADKPIQIIGGHRCANVPDEIFYCDHLEETVWPLSTAATRFIAVGPVISDDPQPDQVVRVIATQPGTTLTYEPPQAGAPTSIAQAGDWIEWRTTKDVEVRANLPVLVAQYQVGAAGSPTHLRTGDPSLTFALPVERYKTTYTVNTLPGVASFVQVVAPLGSIVRLDGELVTALTPIGSSGFGVARQQLALSFDTPGIHHVTASAPFGVDVFGYYRYASYWLPAELPSK